MENEKLADIVYDETGHVSESACYVGNQYIIKFTPNLGSVENHIALSQAIESVGLATASPIKTIDDKFVVASEDIYFYVTKRLKGKIKMPKNFILCGDNWGVLDFDLSERNIRIFAPCYAATAILSESFEADNADKLNQWISIYKNILYGYDEVANLSENEWKAIPYVVITNQLISTAWFSEQEKYKELYEINKKMTEWMMQNFDNMSFE